MCAQEAAGVVLHGAAVLVSLAPSVGICCTVASISANVPLPRGSPVGVSQVTRVAHNRVS